MAISPLSSYQEPTHGTLRLLITLYLSPVPSLAGTTERVCLIQGTVEALNGVHNFIAEKVREMPQSAQKPEPVSILQPQTTVNPDRVKQVRYCTVDITSSTPHLVVASLTCSPGHDPQSGRVRKMWGYVVIFTYSLSLRDRAMWQLQPEPMGLTNRWVKRGLV